jgi:hypothetical protein
VDGLETPFYRSDRESTHWGVRDPDMSDKETEHIWKRLLEPDHSTGHVWCMDLTRGKADGTDMSGPWTGYVRRSPLEPRYPIG